MKLVIQDLKKEMRGSVVLSEINMELSSGEVVGLEGVNGSGKTMLLRAIAGLIRPTSGFVSIDGKRLWKDIPFPQSVGVLIENPAFLESRTGLANLMILGAMRRATKRGGLDASSLREAARESLRMVGLDPDDKRKYKKYSLGMKQRLGIAAATMGFPQLILLDEPTNALDVEGSELVRRLILEAKGKGSLVVVASHDKDFLGGVADEVHTLREGRIVSFADAPIFQGGGFDEA